MIPTLLHTVAATGSALCNQAKPCDTGLPNVNASTAEVQQILQIVFAILGAIAVLVIVISGLRFIGAQGNPQEVAKARNTALYAIIGIIIVIASEAIVSFVLFQAGKA